MASEAREGRNKAKNKSSASANDANARVERARVVHDALEAVSRRGGRKGYHTWLAEWEYAESLNITRKERKAYKDRKATQSVIRGHYLPSTWEDNAPGRTSSKAFG